VDGAVVVSLPSAIRPANSDNNISIEAGGRRERRVLLSVLLSVLVSVDTSLSGNGTEANSLLNMRTLAKEGRWEPHCIQSLKNSDRSPEPRTT